jgi:hypothetical protein
MTTITDFPFCGLLTITLDPKGRVRCAAVLPAGSNAWPLAVRRPEAYQVATIRWPAQVPPVGGCFTDCPIMPPAAPPTAVPTGPATTAPMIAPASTPTAVEFCASAGAERATVIESEASTLRKQCKRDFSVRTKTNDSASDRLAAASTSVLARIGPALAGDIQTIKRKSTGVGSKNGYCFREDNLTAQGGRRQADELSDKFDDVVLPETAATFGADARRQLALHSTPLAGISHTIFAGPASAGWRACQRDNLCLRDGRYLSNRRLANLASPVTVVATFEPGSACDDVVDRDEQNSDHRSSVRPRKGADLRESKRRTDFAVRDVYTQIGAVIQRPDVHHPEDLHSFDSVDQHRGKPALTAKNQRIYAGTG